MSFIFRLCPSCYGKHVVFCVEGKIALVALPVMNIGLGRKPAAQNTWIYAKRKIRHFYGQIYSLKACIQIFFFLH